MISIWFAASCPDNNTESIELLFNSTRLSIITTLEIESIKTAQSYVIFENYTVDTVSPSTIVLRLRVYSKESPSYSYVK